MFRNKSASSHSFAMIPRADVPRSSFRMQKALKTSFDSGFLVPMFCEEVLPGDTCRLQMTCFARLATPLFPFMDNLHFESFFFFVPNRLVWDKWQRFMGEQANPGDSIDFLVPQIAGSTFGFTAADALADYFGLPLGTPNSIFVSALPFRGYNLIYNEWFRDQNLQSSVLVPKGDGPDTFATNYALLRRGKRHDYFTSALPFLQKGNPASIPLGTSAPIRTNPSDLITGAQNPWTFRDAASGVVSISGTMGTTTTGIGGRTTTALNPTINIYPANLYADLTTATTVTINTLRQSFQIQKLLERDARGGTRYTELIRAHFGVVSPDARLQRPEYLGGGRQRISVNPIAQTSATAATGSDTPQGNLAAFSTMLAHGHGFTQAFTEHGYVIGLMNVYADLTYQQGLRRHWSRRTKYDFYWPAFAMLGEQAIKNREIFAVGSVTPNTGQDEAVFGYQERWAEYRYNPSEVTGLMRSVNPNSIDQWHLAQEFGAVPTLNSAFIQETPPVQRVVAVGNQAAGQELIADLFFDMVWARPLPMYSVPGLIDHF